MLPFIQLKKCYINKSTKQKGFAVLTSTVLLSLAGIVFTANMASSQLIDNQIVGNYYRNNEAFANAESGVNFVLSQLDDSASTQALLKNLPMTYENIANHYKVIVKEITPRKLSITSESSSIDGSAKRQINLEVDLYINFPIPTAALSVNGKINLDEFSSVNDGCEGLGSSACMASGSVAKNMLVSNPKIEINGSDLCSDDGIGKNTIETNVLKGESSGKTIDKITDINGIERYNWESVSIPEGSEINGLTPDLALEANSLFEATFGLEMNQENIDELWLGSAQVDMRNGGDCSSMLHNVDVTKDIIYIKGDCNVSQYDAQNSKTSEKKVFTIGSIEHPKLVFIEGGTFITPANTDASIIGMLYFLPSTHTLVDEVGNLVDLNGTALEEQADAIQIKDTSVDMGGVNVNGALLSEYQCSHDGQNKEGNSASREYLSARFDKLILDKLYYNLGIGATKSGYRLSAGTWRDF